MFTTSMPSTSIGTWSTSHLTQVIEDLVRGFPSPCPVSHRNAGELVSDEQDTEFCDKFMYMAQFKNDVYSTQPSRR